MKKRRFDLKKIAKIKPVDYKIDFFILDYYYKLEDIPYLLAWFKEDYPFYQDDLSEIFIHLGIACTEYYKCDVSIAEIVVKSAKYGDEYLRVMHCDKYLTYYGSKALKKRENWSLIRHFYNDSNTRNLVARSADKLVKRLSDYLVGNYLRYGDIHLLFKVKKESKYSFLFDDLLRSSYYKGFAPLVEEKFYNNHADNLKKLMLEYENIFDVLNHQNILRLSYDKLHLSLSYSVHVKKCNLHHLVDDLTQLLVEEDREIKSRLDIAI